LKQTESIMNIAFQLRLMPQLFATIRWWHSNVLFTNGNKCKVNELGKLGHVYDWKCMNWNHQIVFTLLITKCRKVWTTINATQPITLHMLIFKGNIMQPVIPHLTLTIILSKIIPPK